MAQLKARTPEIVTLGVLQNANGKQAVVVHHELSTVAVHLAQGVDQFDNRIGSHTSRRTGKNVLQRAKGTGFIVLQSGGVGQKAFRFFVPLPLVKAISSCSENSTASSLLIQSSTLKKASSSIVWVA